MPDMVNPNFATVELPSTRKASTKRAHSPEPATSVVTQSSKKRSKQFKSASTTDIVAKPSGTTVENSTKMKTTEVEPSAPTQVHQSDPPPPNFTGNFDLYDMELPFLSKVCYPKGTSTPQYELLYETILTFQAKDDNTAQVFVASPIDSGSASIFESAAVMDPMEDLPFEVAIHSINHQVSLSLPNNKRPPSPGISGSMSLKESHCGIQSTSGTFKLRRVWTKAVADGDFIEVFEGHFSFNVVHSGLYKRKGHGSGARHQWSFWAVRARTDNSGQEVGLRPMLPISVNAKAGVPAMHPILTPEVQTVDAELSSSSPKFAGHFDLYSMSDLMEEGHVQKSPFPEHNDVYHAITECSPTITATCYLGAPVPSYDDDGEYGSDDLDDDVTSKGKFQGPTICDPFVEEQYDMVVTSIEEKGTIGFTEDELEQFPERDSDPSGPGMTAQLSLSTHGHHGVDNASGYIKFVRVWTKGGQELFEAYLEMEAVFEYKFALKHRDRSETHAIAFWAVRARAV